MSSLQCTLPLVAGNAKGNLKEKCDDDGTVSEPRVYGPHTSFVATEQKHLMLVLTLTLVAPQLDFCYASQGKDVP